MTQNTKYFVFTPYFNNIAHHKAFFENFPKRIMTIKGNAIS